jgi:hypothetical protein
MATTRVYPTLAPRARSNRCTSVELPGAGGFAPGLELAEGDGNWPPGCPHGRRQASEQPHQ